MNLYGDVPDWIRLTGKVKKRQSSWQNFNAYYRTHQRELTQERRELEALENNGEIVVDGYTWVCRAHSSGQRKAYEKGKKV